jgi:hypothetical protein
VDLSHCAATLPSVLDGSTGPEQSAEDLGCLLTQGTSGYGFEMGLEAMQTALSPTLLGGDNAGFLREDALLVVFFVTDENDCSDRGALDKTNGNVCEWFSDALVPVQDYVDFLGDLKGSADNVVVGGLIAPDNGLRPVVGEDTQPSCDGGAGEGYAGWRYQELMASFSSVDESICESDLPINVLDSLLVEIDNKL